ncbi:MAG: glycosyltransferase family 4 protein, partial [Methyloligellaceae bacterium]
DRQIHPIHREIRAPVCYLPERLRDQPLRVLRALLAQARNRRFRAAFGAWLSDLRRDPTRDRIRRFGQGVVLAHELDAQVGRLHAHFLHTPATATRYASLLTGLPWSCSAHARDIWTIGDWEKAQKLREMAWLVTCTETGRAHLAALAPSPEKVRLVYHGLDLSRFPPAPAVRPARDGSSTAKAVTLISVGRAVEKKGFDLMLEALARLPDRLHWRWLHVGDGALLAALGTHAARLGLGDRVEWRGALPHDAVLEQYRTADLFVLPCRVARDGDRDGLPNVLLEAQAQGLACLSTHISAVPELIDDGETGMLIPPEDPDALAQALTELIESPEERRRLALAGLSRVTADFSHEAGLRELAERFGLAPDQAGSGKSAA